MDKQTNIFAYFSQIWYYNCMEFEEKIKKIEEEIALIKQRNAKVEADKAWETSFSRKFLLVSVTYLVIVIFMYFAEIKNPWLNAIVPSVGFYLSTLTLPILKKTWIKKNFK